MSQAAISDRHSRLRNLRDAPRGNVSMAKCKCGHLVPLPAASLIKRSEELLPGSAFYQAR